MSISIVVGDGNGKWFVVSDGQDTEGDVIVSHAARKQAVRGGAILCVAGSGEVCNEVLHEFHKGEFTYDDGSKVAGSTCPTPRMLAVRVQSVIERLHVKPDEKDGCPPWMNFAAALVISGDPYVYDICATGAVRTVFAEVYAIGAGRQYALGAYHALMHKGGGANKWSQQGYAARRAIDVACMMSPYCGGVVWADELDGSSVGVVASTLLPIPSAAMEGLKEIAEATEQTAQQLLEGATFDFGRYEDVARSRLIYEMRATMYVPDSTLLKPPFKINDVRNTDDEDVPF